MNKYLYFFLIIILFQGCASSKQGSDPSEAWTHPSNPSVMKQEVMQLAQSYGLLDTAAYGPSFGDEQLIFWVKSGLNKFDLRREFQMRQTVLRLAQQAGVQIPSHGDFSFYAEQLRDGTMNWYIIKMEFKDKRKNGEWISSAGQSAEQMPPAGSVVDKETIIRLALQAGLQQTGGFAPEFKKGDASYWELKYLDEDTLKEEFAWRRKVIDLAGKAGYRISTQADLSFFAEELKHNRATSEFLLELFKRKA